MKLIVALFVFILFLSGCSTAYKKKNPLWGNMGYEDRQISNGVFEISILVNDYTAEKTAVEYWHRRAVELCGDDRYSGRGEVAKKEVYRYAGVGNGMEIYFYTEVMGIATCTL